MEIPAGAIPEDQFQQVPPEAIPEDQFQTQGEPQNGTTVPQSGIPEGAIPEEDFNKYGTTEQKTITALEGAARGATFGLSTKAETALGLANEEDIAGRQAANPLIAAGSEAAGAVGSALIPGVGEGWILAKAAKTLIPIAEEASALAKVGRLALRGAFETAGFQTGDEISNAFLHKGDSGAAIAGHIVSAGAVGMLTGGAFGAGGQALKTMQTNKIGNYLDDFAIGIGAASQGPEHVAHWSQQYIDHSVPMSKGFNAGVKFFDETSKKMAKGIADKVTEATAVATGNAVGGPATIPIMYELAKKYLNPMVEKISDKATPWAMRKVAVPIFLRAIQLGDTVGVIDALNYGTKAASGVNKINSAVDSIFKAGGQKALNYSVDDYQNDKLDKYVTQGGIDQQMQQLVADPQSFAEGGRVEAKPIEPNSGLSQLYPEQNIMLTAAKTRVANYLKSMQPQQSPKLMFDNEYKDLDKERSYRKALQIANKPLTVVHNVTNGTLTMEDVKHLSSMYPELHNYLSKRITKELTNYQSEEKRPPYATRQALSLFLGSTLSSEMTPASIMAAQSTFMPVGGAPQQPQGKKNKTNKSELSKLPDDYETQEQARDKRKNKG